MTSTFTNVVVSVVVCTDGSVLCKLIDGYVYPIVGWNPGSRWKYQSMTDIQEACGLNIPNVEFHKWFKIFDSTSIAVFTATINQVNKQKSNLKVNLSWVLPTEMATYHSKRMVTSHILLDFFPKLNILNYETMRGQFLVNDMLIEVRTNLSEPLFKKSDVITTQDALFKDFFCVCQPNVLMSKLHFVMFMKKFNLEGQWLDFITILSVIEPDINKSTPMWEMRKTLLFRMFDTDLDNILRREEVEDLIDFIRLPNDPDIRSCLTRLMSGDKKTLSFEEFSRNIDQILGNALTKAFHLPDNCCTLYYNSASKMKGIGNDAKTDCANRKSPDSSQLQQTYNISSITFRYTKSGSIINVEEVWSLKDVCSSETLNDAGITKKSRQLANNINDTTLIYNEQITNLRYITYLNNVGSPNVVKKLESFKWGTASDTLFGQKLLQICVNTKKIVEEERRLLDIKPPVYILGSIHGNYGDLACFERNLWPRSPGYSPGCVLFLGGYVDKVPFGIEVITFLFCYKNLFPKKIYMLRGSDEVRKNQLKDCFQRECIIKFGVGLGEQVWDAINGVFDSLPLAAVIDDKILCVHSGIPRNTVCSLAKFIDNVPCPLPDPEKTSELAWELFSNEPWPNNTSDPPKIDIQCLDGFSKNTKRGTGYYYSNDAVNKFLDTNFYSHLIRTNYSTTTGFSFTDKGRLLTVCSSSHYSTSKHCSACLLVGDEKIRVLRLGASNKIRNTK